MEKTEPKEVEYDYWMRAMAFRQKAALSVWNYADDYEIEVEDVSEFLASMSKDIENEITRQLKDDK